MRTFDVLRVTVTELDVPGGAAVEEVVFKPREIRLDEDTTDWMEVRTGEISEVFLCPQQVVETMLWVTRPHTETDP